MANPSLQIGNSNWAIKEDNLLGYSTAGTRFVPQPITMTRASAGTRVNSSGLVETVELLGSELITDGNFPTPNVNWTIQGGASTTWVINNNIATRTGSANWGLFQNITRTVGSLYKITFNVLTYTSGTLAIVLGGVVANVVSGTGSKTLYLIWDGSTDRFSLQNNFIGSISNISVKEVTRNNLARVDYDGTASSLLVEPQRTNLLTYSEDFSNAVWSEVSGGSASNPVLTNDYAISPDGTENATRCLFDMGSGTTTSDYSRLRHLNLTATTPVISLYIKSNNANTYQLNFSYGGDSTFLVDAKPNEWTRVDKSTTASGSFDYRLELRGTYTSDDIADVLIWGAQAEEGSYPTSYIPTDGSTVTRVQDQYSKTGISNLINSEEGVLFVEMAALSDDSTNRMLSLYSSGNDKLTLFYKTASNSMTVQGFVGGGLQINRTIVLTDITEFSKIAIRYKTNDFAWYVDGIKITDDTSTNTWSADTLNKLSFDDGAGGNPLFAKVKQLQVFKTALTDTELATLTT
jgi:hypothetical protein